MQAEKGQQALHISNLVTKSVVGVDPLTARVNVDGISMDMEVDSGAAILAVSEDLYIHVKLIRELTYSNIVVREYTGI